MQCKKINGYKYVIHYIPENGTYFSNVDARTSEQFVDTFSVCTLTFQNSMFKCPTVIDFFLFLENS